MRKFISSGLTVLLVGLYLIYSYNNKGHCYIYNPIYISVKADLPENCKLDLNYTTINDPVTPLRPNCLLSDSIDNDTYVFKIDSSYRIKSFRIFLLSLQEEKEFIISEIKAYNINGGEFNFSLDSKDLIVTDNLKLNDLSTIGVGIRKVANTSLSTPSLFFDLRGSFNNLFTSSGVRAPEIPSLFASIIILLLLILMVYALYPLTINIKFKGISPGAYFLALAIIILPTGEKFSNLLIIISLVIGIIINFKERSLRSSLINNKLLLSLTLFSIIIYTLSYLISAPEAYSKSIFFLKLGLPMTLLSITINIRDERDIRLQYAALIAGVIVSVFIHFGWTIIFADSVGLNHKLISNPLYYLESSIFSRVHHSYLSLLYLVSITIILFQQKIIAIEKRERIIYSSVICIMILLAFSRATILSLVLLLFYYVIKKLAGVLKFDITLLVRFSTFVILAIALLSFIFIDFKVYPSLDNNFLSGLQTRVHIWENASDIIRQKPLTGWGPNGYRIELNKMNNLNINYSNYGMNLSTHNQFLATSGMFGIIIGVGLLWFLIFPTGFSRRNTYNSDYIFAIAIIFISNFLFESFLNRNLGILIFGLVYGLTIRLTSITSMNLKNNLS